MTPDIHEMSEGADKFRSVILGTRVIKQHDIMPMADCSSVMTRYSKRHHLASAKLAVSTTAWVHAVDVVIAPMIDNIGRLSVQSRACVVFHDTLLPKLNYGELRVQNAGWVTGRDV